MTDPTYGEFVSRAGVTVARAMRVATATSRTDHVLALAHGLDVLRDAIRRHAEFGADPWSSRGRHNRRDEPADVLVAVLRPAWLPTDDARGVAEETETDWARAARYLGAATDLLATHVGPDGRQLTDDARKFVDADGRRQLVRDAAQLGDTLAEYALHVARHVAGESHDEKLRNVVARWFEHGGQVRSAAYRILTDTAVDRRRDELTDLAAAPLLRCEPVANLHDGFRAYDRLRRLCHAQAVGDLRPDVSGLRGFAALGYTITGYAHVVHTAVGARATSLGLDCAMGEHHDREADSFWQANTAWGDLHAALAQVRDAGGGPIGWQADVLGVREQLDRIIRRDRHLLRPEELVPDVVTARSLLAVTDRFTTGLGSIAIGQRDCVRRLYRSGQLHVPTRQLEGADIPRRYAPMPPQRFDGLLITYDIVSTATRDAADDVSRPRPGCGDSRRGPSQLARLRQIQGPGAQRSEVPVIAR